MLLATASPARQRLPGLGTAVGLCAGRSLPSRYPPRPALAGGAAVGLAALAALRPAPACRARLARRAGTGGGRRGPLPARPGGGRPHRPPAGRADRLRRRPGPGIIPRSSLPKWNVMSLLDCVERQTGANPEWTILWLHGLGADGHDFEPIVPELVRPGWPALRFVFPHAPVRPVTINGGVPMRAWYDIRDLSIENRADEAGVRESMAQVEALIAREGERGVPASRLVLAGFSQGG